jgi:hypothetical protein
MFKTANLRTIGAALFGMLLVAGLSAPGRAAPRTVRVEEPEDGAHHFMLPPINLDVIKAFSDRVVANERFTLTKAPAELVVFIVCVDSDKDSLVKIDFCTYKIEYRSKNAPEFNMPLGTPSPVAGFTASEIAECIFQSFITATLETKLSVADSELTFRVAEFCSKPANRVPCSGKIQ